MRKKNEIIVLRGGPDCGLEFRNGWLPDVWSVPVPTSALVPTPVDGTPPPLNTIDYRRTGLRSASGAYVYDWTGLNWGPLGELLRGCG